MSDFKTIWLSVVCLLLFSRTYSQHAWLDSLKNAADVQQADTNKVWTLRSIADYYVFNNPDSAIIYAKQAVAIAEGLQYDKGLFWSIQTLHNALHVTGNYTEELNYALKAIPIADKLDDLYALGWKNGMLADSYIGLGDYASAMQYIRVVMKNIAEHFPSELYSGYAAIVPIYIGLHQLDTALIYARHSVQLLKAQPALHNGKSNDGKYAKSQVYLALGQAFEANHLPDSALFYYRQSIPFSVEMQMKINAIDAYKGLAHVFNEKKQIDSAIWYAKTVLADSLINSYPAAKINVANHLADVYEEEKETDSSLKYLRIAEKLKDSLYSREKTSAFQNALLKEQEKQKEVEAATTKLKNRYVLYFLTVLAIALIFVISFVIRNRRMKQLQTIRNSIADDLHDEIGSTLSSISIMNELAKAKSPDALPLLTSIGDSTAAIQESMSDIVWAVNPTNDHFENLLQRMQFFAAEITNAKNIQLQFEGDVSLNTTRLTMKQRKNIYLFFKEAVNNAVKHSFAKSISIAITRKGHHIKMTVTDDGRGFYLTKVSEGNGMYTLKKRADELNAVYNINSHPNEGTTVQLMFKVA